MLKPVTITVNTADGCTHTRKFEPGSAIMDSQQEFNEFALGNVVSLIMTGYTDWMDASYFNGSSIDYTGVTNATGVTITGIAWEV